MDRTVIYRKHLEESANKLKKRNSLIRKLTGTTWNASPSVLKLFAFALCFCVAEYYAPVWGRSSHTPKIDIQLCQAIRIITGTLKSTPLFWLPTLSSIASPHLKRELATQRQHNRLNSTEIETQLKQIMKEAPTTTTLKSRRPFYSTQTNDYNLQEKRKKEWQESILTGDLLEDPTSPQPGFHSLTRKQWTRANRIRIWHGRTAANLHKWGYWNFPTCTKCHLAP